MLTNHRLTAALVSEESLREFVRLWENGAISRTEWTHAAHIAVSAYYAFHRSPEELFRVMREGIINFNTSAGINNGPDSGYHETLTRFWSNIISDLQNRRSFASPLQAAREAVHLYGEERNLHNLFYSFDVMRSRPARLQWIRPDRSPTAK